MCNTTLAHTSAINHIRFLRQPSNSEYSNRFFLLDSNSSFSTFECKLQHDSSRNLSFLQEVTLTNSYSTTNCLPSNPYPLFHYHFTWLNDTNVIFCTNENAQSTKIVLTQLNDQDKCLDLIDSIIVEGIVANLTASDKSNKIIYHLADGQFHEIEIIESKLQSDGTEMFDLNGFFPHLDCITVDNELKVIALSSQQNLYVNDEKIATDVTSFLLTEEFLLFTTLDQLKFIRLNGNAQEVINERRIERGGELIATVAQESRTVLQMPRGNLEAIQPRVLSLCIIGKLLDAHSYHKAFDLLRKQRINLNLLADHDPTAFLSNIREFIADIGSSQWLNLFLSDLQDDDVTVTMYSSNYQHLSNRNGVHESLFRENGKINVICEQCCKVFAENSSLDHLLPMITANVKRKNLEAALQLIWTVRLTELNQMAATKPSAVTSQEALKYLLYLVNVNELYDVALGMYDFELVLFVAQKSQKDPKEYLPFLNELKQLEENYRKYRIDNHLKRYEKALCHIVKCGVEKLEECLELIEKHNLYTQAIRLFKPCDECYNDVVLLYADHLRSKGIFYESSLMYERGGDYKQACLSAKHTLDWKKCHRLANKCSYSSDEIEKLCL